MRSKDAVMFDSQKKFEPELFTEYDENECLLDIPSMEKFFKIFSDEFDFTFYGIDIIVDVRSGVHYIVDCNYLSNYSNVPMGELVEKVDGVIREKSLRPKARSGISYAGVAAIGVGLAALATGIAYFLVKKR